MDRQIDKNLKQFHFKIIKRMIIFFLTLGHIGQNAEQLHPLKQAFITTRAGRASNIGRSRNHEASMQ